MRRIRLCPPHRVGAVCEPVQRRSAIRLQTERSRTRTSSKTMTRSMSERRVMATTVRPRVNGTSDRVSDRERATGRDQQYDLLTAAVLGAVIGAGAALLLRRGPSGRRPISPLAGVAGGAAAGAAKWAGK